MSGTSQVSTVTDPASIVQATYTYDSAGRVASVKDALNKYTYTSYTTRGEVYRQWGDATYPVEYGYDNWGHQTTMKTFRAGTGWTASTWPSSPGTADTTTWTFQEATGLLSSKTDAASKSVSYTYTQAGQIATRQWARIQSGSTHVTATYSYSSTTAELTGVTYNDGTPSLAYTYNRMGNQATVTDATGSRTFNYNLSGTLELQSEDLPTFFGSRRITYPVATSGILGRSTGLQLGTSGSPTAEQNVTYGYDTYGRFNSLGAAGRTLSYGYTGSSNLLASIEDTTSGAGTGWKQTRTYLSNRDLLDVIETKYTTSSKAKFDYAHDNLGRRTGVNKTGDLYVRYGNGTQGLDTTWGYDDRSQVTAEQTKLGGSSTVLTGRDDAYAWDNIGNRASTAGTTHNTRPADYTTNALNQYTQRTVPGYFDVAGAAAASATVTVNSSSSGVTHGGTYGDYFFKEQPLANGSGAVFSTLTVSDGTTSTNIAAFLAKTAEVFSYDDDGNLTSDGRWDYVYDAENRLVSMQTHGYNATTYAIANADARRLEFTYDYLGRRVEKLVRAGWNGSSFTTVVSEERFVYSGWNAMAKLNALSSNALVASYYWGLDWSGTLQGAGGVGGLVLSVEGGNSYEPIFDGNGNVMGLVKASSGSIDAAYEYDAFGNTLRESGTYAASNPWRFSTKYTDIETSLVYYGLRYYSPSLGRFINKDPIEERGGLNLYAFCGNNGVNKWDHFGMSDDWTTVWGWSGTPESSWIAQPDGSIYWDTTNHVAYARRAETRGTEEDPGDTIGDGGASLYSTFNQASEVAKWSARNDTSIYLMTQNAEFAAMEITSRTIYQKASVRIAPNSAYSPAPRGSGLGVLPDGVRSTDPTLYASAEDAVLANYGLHRDPLTGQLLNSQGQTMQTGAANDATVDLASLVMTPPFIQKIVAGAAALFGRAAEKTTTLFRVVGPDELASLQKGVGYSGSPGGLESKYFYPTAEQGANFAANPGNAKFGPFTLTRAEVPTSLIDPKNTISVFGEGTVVTIPNQLLPNIPLPAISPSLPLPSRKP